ncbi:MAG: hypothetical protein ACYC10_20695 [Allorhizobium sp.]
MYLRDRMERIYDRSYYVLLIIWVCFVLFVALYSAGWLEWIWRGLLIIFTRGRSDPAA